MNTVAAKPGAATVAPSVSALARQARRRRRIAILMIQIALAIGALGGGLGLQGTLAPSRQRIAMRRRTGR